MRDGNTQLVPSVNAHLVRYLHSRSPYALSLSSEYQPTFWIMQTLPSTCKTWHCLYLLTSTAHVYSSND